MAMNGFHHSCFGEHQQNRWAEAGFIADSFQMKKPLTMSWVYMKDKCYTKLFDSRTWVVLSPLVSPSYLKFPYLLKAILFSWQTKNLELSPDVITDLSLSKLCSTGNWGEVKQQGEREGSSEQATNSLGPEWEESYEASNNHEMEPGLWRVTCRSKRRLPLKSNLSFALSEKAKTYQPQQKGTVQVVVNTQDVRGTRREGRAEDAFSPISTL